MRLLAIALTLLLAAGGAQAAVESDLVRTGMAAYDDLDFQKSVELLNRALHESLTKEEKTATYKTLAFAYVALNRTAEAETAFENLLRVEPAFQLDRTISPRVRKAFEAAQTRVAMVGIEDRTMTPGMNLEAPRQIKQGKPVGVRVTYPGGMASKMALFYRTRGQSKFSRIEARGAGGVFQAMVPGMQVAAPALEYYVTLVDDFDVGAASAGSLGRPLAVEVQGIKTPIYKRGAFWAG